MRTWTFVFGALKIVESYGQLSRLPEMNESWKEQRGNNNINALHIFVLHQISLLTFSKAKANTMHINTNPLHPWEPTKTWLTKTAVHFPLTSLRNGSHYQILEKFQGGSFSVQKFILQILGLCRGLFLDVFQKNCNIIFQNKGWGSKPFGFFPKIHLIW